MDDDLDELQLTFSEELEWRRSEQQWQQSAMDQQAAQQSGAAAITIREKHLPGRKTVLLGGEDGIGQQVHFAGQVT